MMGVGTHRLLVPRAHLSPEEAGAVLLAPTVSLSGMFPARLATLGGGGLHVAQVGADGVVLAGLEKVLCVGVKQASIVRRMEGRSQLGATRINVSSIKDIDKMQVQKMG
jgi:hypothetical protein